MYKLVIIDDDILTVEGIQKHIPLKDLNIEVVATAYNGYDGVKIIKETLPDIILSDIQMPEMNGFEMISAIKEVSINPQIILLTGMDDFKYAKLAIDASVLAYIVKPFSLDEIIDALKKAATICDKKKKQQELYENLQDSSLHLQQQQLVKQLFLGKNSSDIDLYLTKNKYSMDLIDKKYCCISINSQNREQQINQTIEKLCDEFDVYYAIIFPEYANLLIVFDNYITDRRFYSDLSAILSDMAQKLFITVSEIETELSNIHYAYKEAQKMQEYAFCFNFCGILQYQDYIYEYQKFSANPPVLDKHKYLDAIFLQEYITLNEILTHIEDSFSKLIIYDPDYLKSLMFDFCNMTTLGFSIEKDDDSSDLWSDIINCKTKKELFAYCHNVLSDFKAATQSDKLSEENKIVLKMQKYVEEHYSEQISLVSLSRHLYYSRNYLKIIFFKHTGKDFKLYLQDFRMKKAGSLLANSSLRLFEIAEAVGYRSIKTFRKVFVKYYGVLPSEYNQNNTKTDTSEKEN